MSLIALHVHTYPSSKCSEMLTIEAIIRAKEIGLDGICLTEHNYFWPEPEILKLKKELDFNVFRGVEVDTDEGHVIALGVDRSFDGITPIAVLKAISHACGGFLIAAHPFRGFLVFNSLTLGMTVQDAQEKHIFKNVDAVEAFSGRMNRDEIELSLEVAKKNRLLITGGSDAHRTNEIERFVTQFEGNIRNEQMLISELRSGKFSVIQKSNLI